MPGRPAKDEAAAGRTDDGRSLIYSDSFKREALRDARLLGVRAAARLHGIDRKTLRGWKRDDDLRLAQPTADEVALLERDDLGPKDLPALTAARSRGIDLLTGEIDPADLPRSPRT